MDGAGATDGTRVSDMIDRLPPEVRTDDQTGLLMSAGLLGMAGPRPKRQVLAAMDFTVENDARQFREGVMMLAAEMAAPISVAVIALADVLGHAAAKLDREEGRQNLDDRLHAFCARVRVTYDKVRNQGETKAKG